MSTTFPTTLQDLDATRGTTGQPLSAPNHITHHNTEDDTIEALQAKVGVNGSAVTTTHDYKLSGVTSSDVAVSKTGTETLTNKTITDSTNNVMAKSLKSATTTVDVSAATAPSSGQVLTATATTTATWQTPVVVPTGSIFPYGASSAPTGYLLCDGTSYLRTDYAALFAIIGTTYGAADGTHFTVPSLKGKVVVGYNSAETEFDTLGETGGEKTHALIAGELPNVTLTVPRAGNNTAGSGGYFVMSTSNGGENIVSGGLTGAGGTAHNNLQPYIAMPYIIKT